MDHRAKALRALTSGGRKNSKGRGEGAKTILEDSDVTLDDVERACFIGFVTSIITVTEGDDEHEDGEDREGQVLRLEDERADQLREHAPIQQRARLPPRACPLHLLRALASPRHAGADVSPPPPQDTSINVDKIKVVFLKELKNIISPSQDFMFIFKSIWVTVN